MTVMVQDNAGGDDDDRTVVLLLVLLAWMEVVVVMVGVASPAMATARPHTLPFMGLVLVQGAGTWPRLTDTTTGKHTVGTRQHPISHKAPPPPTWSTNTRRGG